MRLFHWEETGLQAVEALLQRCDLTDRQLAEALGCCNVGFVLEQINRLQSTLLCELKYSYVQQSQRYVTASIAHLDLSFMEEADRQKACAAVDELYRLYEVLSEKKPDAGKGRPRPEDYVHGIPIEDARYLLPLGAPTNLSIAMEGCGLMELFARLNSALGREVLADVRKVILAELPPHLAKRLEAMEPEETGSFVQEYYRPMLEKVDPDHRMVYLGGFAEPEQRVALGALTSTQKRVPSKVLADWGDEAPTKAQGVVRRVMGYGHTSIAEQARTTFAMMCSMVTYHQQIRHRLPQLHREALSELITVPRAYLVPPTVAASPFVEDYRRAVEAVIAMRKEFFEKYGAKALIFLLNCDQIKMVLSTNARMDCQMLSQRICQTAQWEIRHLSEEKYEILRKFSPQLYRDALPSCIYGACKEGAMTCGKIQEMRKKYRE